MTWYDTMEEFNVDSKAEYSVKKLKPDKLFVGKPSQVYLACVARKKETKTHKRQCPFETVQVKIREGSPEKILLTMEERIGESDVWSER